MRWDEVEDWISRQAMDRDRRESLRALLSLVKGREWDSFYSQTFKEGLSLAAGRVLLCHSLAVLHSSLTMTGAFVVWERLSEVGRQGWHAHCLLSLRSRRDFRPCSYDFKRCGGPSPQWQPLSRSWSHLGKEQLKRSSEEILRSLPGAPEGCSLYCQRKIEIEERLGKRFGWARVDPILLSDNAARAYVVKYLFKTLRAEEDGGDLVWYFVEPGDLERK